MRSIRPLLAASGVARGPRADGHRVRTGRQTSRPSPPPLPAPPQAATASQVPPIWPTSSRTRGRSGEVEERRLEELGQGQVAQRGQDFVNPVIKGLWKPERMKTAKEPKKTIATGDVPADQGVIDPEPAPVKARQEKTAVPPVRGAGRQGLLRLPRGLDGLLGHGRQGPEAPGKSNLVWTAGHCVHAGELRRLVPQHHLRARPTTTGQVGAAAAQRPAAGDRPVRQILGRLGHDLQRSGSRTAAATGGAGAPYDYAVLHVKPENGRQVPRRDGRRRR